MSNIQIIRLISGEEIIADVSYADGIYSLKNPLRIIMNASRTDPEKIGFGFMDWLPHAELKNDTVQVLRDNVLFIVLPKKNFMEEYKRMTSKILTPSTNLIVP